MAKILAFVEQRGGSVKKSSLESLSAARRLAADLGGDLAAVIAGSGIGDAASSLGEYGAATVYAADDASLDLYNTEGYAAAVTAALDACGADVAVFPASAMGKDLAPG